MLAVCLSVPSLCFDDGKLTKMRIDAIPCGTPESAGTIKLMSARYPVQPSQRKLITTMIPPSSAAGSRISGVDTPSFFATERR